MLTGIGRTAAGALLAAAAIAACGGSSGSGLASKSPDAIANAAFAAVHGVKSVHMSGTVLDQGTPTRLDLHVLSGVGANGDVSVGGQTVRVIADGQSVYLNAGSAFWRRFVSSAVAALLQGRWLKAPANSPDFASFVSFTDLHRLFGKLEANHGRLEKGGARTIGGQPAIGLIDTSKSGGTLYVATTGKPYPVELVSAAGGAGGQIMFDHYNESVALTPPPNAIDVNKLQSP